MVDQFTNSNPSSPYSFPEATITSLFLLWSHHHPLPSFESPSKLSLLNDFDGVSRNCKCETVEINGGANLEPGWAQIIYTNTIQYISKILYVNYKLYFNLIYVELFSTSSLLCISCASPTTIAIRISSSSPHPSKENVEEKAAYNSSFQNIEHPSLASPLCYDGNPTLNPATWPDFSTLPKAPFSQVVPAVTYLKSKHSQEGFSEMSRNQINSLTTSSNQCYFGKRKPMLFSGCSRKKISYLAVLGCGIEGDGSNRRLAVDNEGDPVSQKWVHKNRRMALI
ncbi:hypothetical protein LXL04_029598 [Taraxacum kok-saghyz]